jgi:hypothetical protein
MSGALVVEALAVALGTAADRVLASGNVHER